MRNRGEKSMSMSQLEAGGQDDYEPYYEKHRRSYWYLIPVSSVLAGLLLAVLYLWGVEQRLVLSRDITIAGLKGQVRLLKEEALTRTSTTASSWSDEETVKQLQLAMRKCERETEKQRSQLYECSTRSKELAYRLERYQDSREQLAEQLAEMVEANGNKR